TKSPRPVAALPLSVVAHGVVIFLLFGPPIASLFGRGKEDNSLVEPPPNLILQFLVPPDRSSAQSEEHIGYVGLPTTGGETGRPLGEPVKVEEKADQGTPVIPQQATAEQKLDGVTQLEQVAQSVGAFSIVDVDSAAIRDPNSAAPSYPKELEKK